MTSEDYPGFKIENMMKLNRGYDVFSTFTGKTFTT